MSSNSSKLPRLGDRKHPFYQSNTDQAQEIAMLRRELADCERRRDADGVRYCKEQLARFASGGRD